MNEMNSQNISTLLKERAIQKIEVHQQWLKIVGILMLVSGIFSLFACMNADVGVLILVPVVGALIGVAMILASTAAVIPDGALLMYGYGELLDRMEKQKSMASEQAEKKTMPIPLQEHPVVESRSAQKTTEPEKGALPAKAGEADGEIVCPSCGIAQRKDRSVCWSCGQRFL